MLIELSTNSQDGPDDPIRMKLPNTDLYDAYKAAGFPYGEFAGIEGIRKLLEDMLNGRIPEEELSTYPIQLAARGQVPDDLTIAVKVIAENEADLIPEGVLRPGYAIRLYSTLSQIRDGAGEFMGNLVAYISKDCEYWTTDKKELDKCSPLCLGHCPHCGSSMIPIPFGALTQMITEGSDKHGAAYYGAVMAAHSHNSGGKCSKDWRDYVEAGEKFTAVEVENNRREAETVEPGLYAHTRTNWELPAAITCSVCEGDAIPAAYVSKSLDKTWLTWECGEKCSHFLAGSLFSEWPFVEPEALEADLEAAGFKIYYC